MTAGRCVFCERVAADLHHVTGRDGHGALLDPELVVHTCHDDHELVGDDRRTLGIEDGRGALNIFERLLVRLQRLALNASRFAEAHPEWAWTGRLAAAFARWAADLEDGIRQLDRRDPKWRTDPGFYPGARPA